MTVDGIDSGSKIGGRIDVTNEHAKLIASAVLLAGALIALVIAGVRAVATIPAVALFLGGGLGLSALLNMRIMPKK